MIDTLPTLSRLVKQLQQVPYLASKNLYRVTHHFLELNKEGIEALCKSLIEAHTNLIKCRQCWAWQEKNTTCVFCGNGTRNQSLICVVETWYDLYSIEKSGGYMGVYHILGGAISPLDGLGPDDLTISALVQRVNPEQHKEVILALNQTPEGEATAIFIARKLKQVSDVMVTCLARGVPVGSSLEFTDRLTVHKALAERRAF